jgi:hypothetical protein
MMKPLTLVTHRKYFGMNPLLLRAATDRVLARVAGLPPERAQVNARCLRQDFGADTVLGEQLVAGFVAEGLLEPHANASDDYRLTERFFEFACARVVEPLSRSRAKLLLGKACELATRINPDWSRNPLEIETLAPFGRYMSRDHHLGELPLGIVVRARAASRRARWGRLASKSEGAAEIRAAFRELSSFVRVRMVNDLQMLPRPFSVVFHQD